MDGDSSQTSFIALLLLLPLFLFLPLTHTHVCTNTHTHTQTHTHIILLHPPSSVSLVPCMICFPMFFTDEGELLGRSGCVCVHMRVFMCVLSCVYAEGFAAEGGECVFLQLSISLCVPSYTCVWFLIQCHACVHEYIMRQELTRDLCRFTLFSDHGHSIIPIFTQRTVILISSFLINRQCWLHYVFMNC